MSDLAPSAPNVDTKLDLEKIDFWWVIITFKVHERRSSNTLNHQSEKTTIYILQKNENEKTKKYANL